MPQPKKVKQDLVSEEFKSVVVSMSDSELKEKVVNLSRNEGEILKAKKDDEELNETKDRLKEMTTPYAEALKKVKVERAYVHTILEERGK